MSCIHKFEYYSAKKKRNELPIQDMIWTNLNPYWKKTDARDHMLHGFVYVKFPEKENL